MIRLTRAFYSLLTGLLSVLLAFGCVDPVEQRLPSKVDVLMVDGTITNLAGPQIIQLTRSFVDPLSEGLGIVPVTKALVEVIVDSLQVIPCPETSDGAYRLPSDFQGQVGHAYQLRFTLSDGRRYVSTQQVMPPVPAISRVTARFNPTSLPAQRYDGATNLYRGAHEVSVDWQDPAD